VEKEGAVVVLLHPLPEAVGAEAVVRQGHAGQQVPWAPAALEAAGVAAVLLRWFLYPESGVG
jgi:hypothetical protein